MRLLFTPLILLWAFAGFCLGFKDIRDWFWFTLLAVCLAWYTAKWLHKRDRKIRLDKERDGSKIRIKNTKKHDVAVIHMDTGQVWLRHESDLQPAAHAFWGAVSVAAEIYRNKRGHEPHDVIMHDVAANANIRPYGDVHIHLPSSVVLEADGGVWTNAQEKQRGDRDR